MSEVQADSFLFVRLLRFILRVRSQIFLDHDHENHGQPHSVPILWVHGEREMRIIIHRLASSRPRTKLWRSGDQLLSCNPSHEIEMCSRMPQVRGSKVLLGVAIALGIQWKIWVISSQLSVWNGLY